jgi:hypothetical protein
VGGESGSGDGLVSVQLVYEGDPEPVEDEQPLGEVMYDLTPDDGVEDDDTVGACGLWQAAAAAHLRYDSVRRPPPCFARRRRPGGRL